MENANFVKRNLLFVLISFVMMVFSCSIAKGYETGDEIPVTDYLTFTAEENGSQVSFTPNSGTVQYSKNNGNWLNANGVPITLNNQGDFVKFKGNDVVTNSSKNFKITGKVSASGSVDSLRLDSSNKFQGLSSRCYLYMFAGCTGLTSAPALPATSLANDCYSCMFRECTGLTSAPALPATSLATGCYSGMFDGCTGLTSAPALPATSLANDCYSCMFSRCEGLTSAPALPATTLANYCYGSMFMECTGLTSAPELPATTLAASCYYGMFSRCTGLTSAPELPATTLAANCYQEMFAGCTGLTSAPALPATSLAMSCYRSMFSGCTGLKNLPTISATSLATDCYFYMFAVCTGLRLSDERISDYQYEWKFKANDSSLDTKYSSMFNNSGYNGTLSPDGQGYVTLYSAFPIGSSEALQGGLEDDSQESGVDSQESDIDSQESDVDLQESGVDSQESGVDSQESGVDSQDAIIGYVNITPKDSDGKFIVEDAISIDGDGTISEMELKWEDESNNVFSLDSLDENTKAYITVRRKKDGAYVASSKLFYLSSEYGRTMIPSQQVYTGFDGQAASDNASDESVWNDKTSAVYILSIKLVDAA